jgi:transposase
VATRRPPGREKNPPTGEPADHALGRSRGGFGTKLHLVSDGHGMPQALPLAVLASPGQAKEARFLEPVLNAVRIPQARGRPKQRPVALAGDRGYSHPSLRHWLARHHVRSVIPTRRDQRPRPLDHAAYRQRNVIERCRGRLKEARRIATRYEKLVLHFLGAVKLRMLQLHLATLSNTA